MCVTEDRDSSKTTDLSAELPDGQPQTLKAWSVLYFTDFYFLDDPFSMITFVQNWFVALQLWQFYNVCMSASVLHSRKGKGLDLSTPKCTPCTPWQALSIHWTWGQKVRGQGDRVTKCTANMTVAAHVHNISQFYNIGNFSQSCHSNSLSTGTEVNDGCQSKSCSSMFV